MKRYIMAFTVLFSLILLVACSSNNAVTTTKGDVTTSALTTDGQTTATVTTAVVTDTPTGLDISDYTVIRPDGAKSAFLKSASQFKKDLNEYVSENIGIADDYIKRGDSEDPSQKAILLGETNREATAAALATLASKNLDNAYIIKVSENKIVICGTDDYTTVKAMKYFMNNFVKSAPSNGHIEIEDNFEYICENAGEGSILANGSLVSIEQISKIHGPSSTDPSPTYTYPRILEVQYDEKNKGTLIATAEGLDKEYYRIFKSVDGGKSWELITTVREQIGKSFLVANWQPYLYELPCKVGEMEAGTLLLAGCSRDRSTASITRMCIWRSSDCGLTWEEYTIVDEGGNLDIGGMWEPFLMCDDDGKLVCFYSDESEYNVHSGQKLVFRVSEDGENWGDKKYVVSATDNALRPGMITVTRLGNGKYFACYEIVGMAGNPIYCKISDSLTDWGAPDDLGKVIEANGKKLGSSPHCVWTPLGGENGTLFVTGCFMASGSSQTGTDLFISTDYGRTWQTIDNPLPYTRTDDHRFAYSPGFYLGADGTVYYVNDVNSKISKKADIKLAILKVEE